MCSECLRGRQTAKDCQGAYLYGRSGLGSGEKYGEEGNLCCPVGEKRVHKKKSKGQKYQKNKAKVWSLIFSQVYIERDEVPCSIFAGANESSGGTGIRAHFKTKQSGKFDLKFG